MSGVRDAQAGGRASRLNLTGREYETSVRKTAAHWLRFRVGGNRMDYQKPPSNRKRSVLRRAKWLRRAITTASWVCIILFLLALPGYFVNGGVGCTLGQTTARVGFQSGYLLLITTPATGSPPRIELYRGNAWTRLGPGGSRIGVPLTVFALLIVLPLSNVGFRAALAERRARRGLCRKCEYDLAGVEIQGGYKVCPECGTIRRVWRDEDAEAQQ